MTPSVAESKMQALAADPKAALVIVHGLAEHASRYLAIAQELARRGVSVFAFDQIGHGSVGDAARAHVEHFDLFVDDASEVCRGIAERTRGLPLFVWGHSMGAIVVLHLVARNEVPLAGVIVTSNSLEIFRRGLNPLSAFFRFASRIMPRVRIPLGLDATKISQDVSVQRAYASDPLVPATASLRLIVEFAQACEVARADAASILIPALIVHGEQDAIAPSQGSQVLFDTIGSSDKTLRIFPGARHEVHNEREVDRAEFIDLLSAWVLARAGRLT